VTATTTNPHGIPNGHTCWVTIAGAAPAGYNGTWLATSTGASTFTYAVPSNPGAETTPGTWIPESANELNAMVLSFFGQGGARSVYVLELGLGSPTDGVNALSAWLIANPGFAYAFLVPRTWDANVTFLALVAQYENTTAKLYFFVTTTLQNYSLYTALEKSVFAMIEAPSYSVWLANVLTALTAAGTTVTATTTTAHGVTAGQYFSISGCTPAAYNGTFLALPGTTGSTLIYQALTAPGAESVLGTLVASPYASAGIPSTEFSLATAFQAMLNNDPAPTNKVPPFAFEFLFGVTPFPTQGNAALLSTLKLANINIVGTGAEGGISDAMILWGVTKDGRDFSYWYSVDWVQINGNINIANAVINGSNNKINPLYYNQAGINRLQKVLAQTMKSGISNGLVLGNVVLTSLDGNALAAALDAGTYDGLTVVNAVPFLNYVAENPNDYPAGIYNGLSVTYTPNRGFISITYNVNVTDFVAA
jgi:hypothetical protein